MYVLGIIILAIVLILLLLVFFKNLNIILKYEVINYNIVRIFAQVYIFNKKVYVYKNEYTYLTIIEKILSKGENKEKQKIDKQIVDTKKAINTIIKDLSREKIHIKIYVGNTNVIFNCYLVTIFSSIISIALAKNIQKKNVKNIDYKVIPMYNKNIIILNVNLMCRIITILKIFVRVKLMSRKGGKNGKSSNRKLNVNSNDKLKRND